jgi:putative toxin-antitoxin system antitoxin component (TIGR02293 family)
MEKPKDNIVTSVSKRTGSSEELIKKILTEFGKVIEEASGKEKAVVAAKKVPNAGKWNLSEVKTTQSEVSNLNYFHYAKQHILDELKSNKKSSEILERFIKMSAIPNKFLAEKVFEISPKTLYTYKHSNKNLPIRINEQILKLEELYKKGIELFGSSEQFNKWLKSESYGLGKVKPIDMTNTITGIDLIYEELIRIEFGATA